MSKELMAAKEQQDKTATERLKETFKRMREMVPTKLERGIVAALHDIHRRVIEEGWYGRTIHDVVSYYGQRIGRNNKDLPGDDLPASQGQKASHDYSPDAFYGRSQGKAGEQQETKQQEHSRGMER